MRLLAGITRDFWWRDGHLFCCKYPYCTHVSTYVAIWLPWPFGPFSLQTMCSRVSCGHWSLPKGSLLLAEKIDGNRSHMRWRNACVTWKIPGTNFPSETESLVRTNLWWDRISGEMRERMCHMKNPGKNFSYDKTRSKNSHMRNPWLVKY